MKKINIDPIKVLRPHIKQELVVSRMGYTYKKFRLNVYKIWFLFMFFIIVSCLFFTASETIPYQVALMIVVGGGFVIFYVLASLPRIMINNIAINVDKEMLQVSRRFLINLQSGQSIFSAYADLAKSNSYSARFFDEVVSKIYLGMKVEDAIKQSIALNPSKNFKKMQNQILSALMTGSDIEKVFEVTLEEMIKEYIVTIEEYGKKLGAVAMIYMIFGTVLPAVGGVALVLLLSMVLPDIQSGFFIVLYIILLFLIATVQFVFISIFRMMKPNLQI